MNDHPSRIDDAIDRAVREMMRRDPPLGLRARVLSRLGEPARRTMPWPVWATAGSALAIVAIAFMIVREPAPSAPTDAPAPAAAAQPSAPSAEPPAVPARPREPASAPARPSRPAAEREPIRTATFGPREGRVAAATVSGARAPVHIPADMSTADWPDAPPVVVVEPLAPLRPLEITPIVVPPIRASQSPSAPGAPPR